MAQYFKWEIHWDLGRTMWEKVGMAREGGGRVLGHQILIGWGQQELPLAQDG